MATTSTTKHIHTPRLTLRLLSSSSNPRDLSLFHENWSSRVATAWSMHGPTATIEESRAWMNELLGGGMQFYAVFLREEGSSMGAGQEEQGVHVGSVSMRLPKDGLMLPPKASWGSQEFELKNLGYALFPAYWGRGIATEAGKAAVDAYGAALRAAGKRGYLEGCVDEGNPASGHVLGKIGFEQVGWKAHDPVWINGAWRKGCWVYGMYV